MDKTCSAGRHDGVLSLTSVTDTVTVPVPCKIHVDKWNIWICFFSYTDICEHEKILQLITIGDWFK
jgi:hypothetical protein